MRPYKLNGYRHLRALRNEAARKQNGLCYWCGTAMELTTKDQPNSISAEHLVPKYAGGKNIAGNIVAACRKCNSERNTETNHLKRQKRVVLSIGDDTPRSPFEKLKG